MFSKEAYYFGIYFLSNCKTVHILQRSVFMEKNTTILFFKFNYKKLMNIDSYTLAHEISSRFEQALLSISRKNIENYTPVCLSEQLIRKIEAVIS